MDTFLKLNRNKLSPTFFRLSFVLLGAVFLVLTIAYFTHNLPNRQLLLVIILATSIGFALLIMFLTYIVWLLNCKARKRVFTKSPFNQIENIGFYKAYKGDNSKWMFTDEIKKGTLNGFTLTMDISKEKSHTLEFEIETKWKELNKSEYNRLMEKFKQQNIEFRIGSLVKYYNIKRPLLKSLSDLKQELELFTSLLHKEGFEPKKCEDFS